MERKRRKINKKPSAILTADWHLRTDVPICRTDDYLVAQNVKVEFIIALAEKYEIPIVVAGDFGNKPQWPNSLLTNIIMACGSEIYIIPGQHDLPYHRLDKWSEGGLGVLDAAGTIYYLIRDMPTHIPGIMNANVMAFPYGSPISHYEKEGDNKLVAIAHQMVIKDKPLWPGQDAPKANALLKKFSEYDLILTGDNHQAFVEEYQGRLLVNPGSMMRMSVNQINHKPRVYLWYANTNEVEAVYLPIEKDVMNIDYLEIKKERDKRIDFFVSHLKQDYETGLSFEKNLEEFFEKNRTRKEIKEKAWSALNA